MNCSRTSGSLNNITTVRKHDVGQTKNFTSFFTGTTSFACFPQAEYGISVQTQVSMNFVLNQLKANFPTSPQKNYKTFIISFSNSTRVCLVSDSFVSNYNKYLHV
ncbi:unnamed protein product [Ceratitis capitata]|uniref:(Mediterranean fruit fly) hypothetical protein n=1 Tax=Ceratitis capitata TaxID=7213 RepID=A0A811U9T0_CERCA|nr:unnamed protein product [Ceratitis capitata]